MAYELLSARLLAPQFGGSLYVITSVLGITMLALLGGYFLGGILSSKTTTTQTPATFIIIAALLLITMPFISVLVFPFTKAFGLIGGTLTTTLLLIGPGLVLLGSVGPLLVQGVNHQQVIAGKATGIVYGISTFGGVLSTFLVGLYFIPQFGVKITAMIFGIITLLVGTLFLLMNKSIFKSGLSIGACIICSILCFQSQILAIPDGMRLLYQSDGVLGSLSVLESNQNHRILMNNGVFQSYIDKNTSKSIMPYTHVIASTASLLTKENRRSAAILGMAAGSLIPELKDLGFEKIVAVDIDSRMKGIAEQYFGIQSEDYTFSNNDGRHYLKTTDEVFDVIIIDVSNAEDQPYHLYTLEAFEEYKNHISPEGLIIVNIVDHTNVNNAKITSRIGDSLFEAGYNTFLLRNIYPELPKDRMEHYAQEKIILGTPGSLSKINESIDDLNPCCAYYPFNRNLKALFPKMTFHKDSKSIGSFYDDCPEMELLNYERIQLLRSKF